VSAFLCFYVLNDHTLRRAAQGGQSAGRELMVGVREVDLRICEFKVLRVDSSRRLRRKHCWVSGQPRALRHRKQTAKRLKVCAWLDW
jgi:hypothetical protein